MTPAAKKKSSGAKSAKKTSKTVTKRAAKTTKKATKKTATKDAKPSAGTATTCAALTAKGTPCRLKPVADSVFCARHQDAEVATPAAAPAPSGTKNGTVAKAEQMSLPEVEAETLAAHGTPPLAAGRGRAKPVRRREAAKPHAEPVAMADSGTVEPIDAAEEADTGSEEEPAAEDEFVLYGSVYSTTLEASPYDDLITPEMAEGSDDVDLVDEHQMGHGARRQQPPRPERPQLTQEEAEAKALEKLGPKPEIAPEEDLDGILAEYDRRFRSEVNFLLGGGRRKRGRRGGRRRGGGGRGGGGGGGGQGGGGGGGGPRGDGGGGRGRRGGRRRGGGGRSGGGGRQGGGGGGGPPRNVARDSPLANNRPSRGPKRAVQPRRRREPDF